MILLSDGMCRYLWVFLWKEASNNSGVVDDRTIVFAQLFRCLATSSEFGHFRVSDKASIISHGDKQSLAVFVIDCKMNKTAELSQRRPRDAPNIWVPWKVLRVLTAHTATSPEICNGLLFRSILRMCVQNLKFVALPVPEIIVGTQKIGQSLDTTTLHFLPKF